MTLYLRHLEKSVILFEFFPEQVVGEISPALVYCLQTFGHFAQDLMF